MRLMHARLVIVESLETAFLECARLVDLVVLPIIKKKSHTGAGGIVVREMRGS